MKKMRKRVHMKKKNTGVLIDGENIAAKKAPKIMQIVNDYGVLDVGKVYGIQKDERTKNWMAKSKSFGIEDIRLYGGPQKNKVDKKIKRDARRLINQHKNVDIICLATNDGGYTDIIAELREAGKKVIVIGEKQASVKLRTSCNTFIEI